MPEWLSRQIGPFPVWAWVGIIAAGGGLGWLILSRTQAGAPDLADTGTGTEGVPPGSPARYLVGANLAPPPSTSPPTETEAEPVAETGPPFQSNEQWFQCAVGPQAQAAFFESERFSPVWLNETLRLYMAGRLTFADLRAGRRQGAATVINAALAHCGPLPNPPALPQPRTG